MPLAACQPRKGCEMMTIGELKDFVDAAITDMREEHRREQARLEKKLDVIGECVKGSNSNKGILTRLDRLETAMRLSVWTAGVLVLGCVTNAWRYLFELIRR